MISGGKLSCKLDCTLDTASCYKLLDATPLLVSSVSNTSGLPAAGVVIDQVDIPFTAKNNYGNKAASVSFDGVNYLVVWGQASGSKSVIFGRRLQP